MSAIDSTQPYIIEEYGILTPDECDELVKRIESLNPEVATVNSYHGVVVKRDVRNNDRVIFDDVTLAELLVERIRERIPQVFDDMTFVGANERFRCYRYREGMRFAPHTDSEFRRDNTEWSNYTFLVYLNEGFEGGQTRFHTKPLVDIEPRTGKGVLFQHPMLHEGVEVTSGIKYVARTDLMYRAKTNFK